MKYISKYRSSKTYVFQSVILKCQRNTQQKLDFNEDFVYKFTKTWNISVFSRNFGKKINKNFFFVTNSFFSIFCHPDVANFRRMFPCGYYHFLNFFFTCYFQILTSKVFIIKCYVETHPLATILCSMSAMFKFVGKNIVKTKLLGKKVSTCRNFSRTVTTFSQFSDFHDFDDIFVHFKSITYLFSAS